MKILKFLLLIVLLVILLFIVMGFIKPTVNYGHEIEVNKSAKEAWAVHQDPTKLNQWLDGFKSIELIKGQENEIGSQYKVVVNPQEGQPDFEMIETLVDKEDYKFITFSFDSDMMVFDQKTSFTESNGKTKIRTESKVVGKGMMMKSMFAMMEIFTGSFQSKEAENIEALKKVIESNATDYYPAPEIEQEDN